MEALREEEEKERKIRSDEQDRLQSEKAKMRREEEDQGRQR